MMNSMHYCTPAFMSTSLERSWDASSADEISAAVQEANDLAMRAKEDAAARGVMERLLYVIHASTGFCIPVQGVAAAVWNTLARAKLAREFQPLFERAPRVSFAEFRDRYLAALRAVDERDHTFFKAAAAERDLRPLRVYAKNWYASTHGFTHQIAATAHRCLSSRTHWHLAKSFVENLSEEYEGTPHPILRRRWVDELGIEYTPASAIGDAEQCTEAFALQNYRTIVASLPDPLYGVGSFLSIEGVFVGVCKQLHPLLKGRGFKDDVISTFELHGEADEDHVRELLDAIEASELGPDEIARVAAGAFTQLHLRSHMFDAIRRTAGLPRS